MIADLAFDSGCMSACNIVSVCLDVLMRSTLPISCSWVMKFANLLSLES